jgi:hypothetical protein
LTGIAAAVLLFAPQLAAASDDDDMPDKINFSGGIRGKFHPSNIRLSLPTYPEADVQDYLAALAAKKGIALSDLANELLKEDIAVLESEK